VKSLETKEPAPEEIRAECDRIVSSPVFENSDRMVRFLRFVVDKTLAQQHDQLKEYLLGVEVFDRAESFDPKTDTIVRVEARRLRRKLKEYYDGDGSRDAVRIDMPSPGYVPVFSSAGDPETALEAAPQVSRTTHLPFYGFLAACAVAAIAAGIWWSTRSGGSAAPIDSIAVLPFADMSSAKDQEYFCDGFTEELISTLASAEGLRVVARTSVFAFKGKAGDIREIGKTLNAGAIVEGSVRRSDGTLRITAQLIRTSDGYHLWSKSYDRKLEDVLAVQREIAELIAGTLSKQLAGGNRTRENLRVPNLEAHDLYLLGRYHWNRLQPGDLEKAVGYFERAISLEPNSAQAYSGLADAYSYMIDEDLFPTAQILPKARAAADRALELDPGSAEAHTARGLVAHELEWDQTRARKEFLRAIELKPSYAYGIHWYAHFLEYQNRFDEAQAQMQRALAIDPLSRMFTIDLAMIHYKQRRYEEALKGIEKARELDPDYFLLDFSRGFVYAAQHDWPRALAAFRQAAVHMGDDPALLGAVAQVEALSGDTAAARRDLARLQQASTKTFVPDYVIALVQYALNDPEQGRNSLKKSLDGHSGLLVWMKTTPAFDQIAHDPKGKEMLQQVGGPPADK